MMNSFMRQRVLTNPCSVMMGESYFSAEGDDDISKAVSEAQALSWRGDPLATHSDWTIHVVTADFDTRMYHVHKSILSVGPRSSKYFANLFHEQSRNISTQPNTTKIELDPQDANVFPIMLDFMYGSSNEHRDDDSLSLPDDFQTSNAVSLRHLARVFDCEGLMLAVNKFIQKDLSLKTGPIYLTQAYLYQDERLVESARRLCADNFTDLETRSILKLPLPLFRSIILEVANPDKTVIRFGNKDGDALSYQLSEIVCQYFEKHPQHLSVELLLELTNEKLMPRMAPEPAIGFTALARDINPKIASAESEEWKSLIDLCKRCAQAVVREYGWRDFNVSSALDEYVDGPCSVGSSKMDSLLFATSFAAALEMAQKDMKKLKEDGTTWKQEATALQQQVQDLSTSSRRHKQDAERYKSVLAETKQELMALKQQVAELRKRQGR